MGKTATSSNVIEVFTRVPSFAGIDRNTLTAVAKAALPHTYSEGQVVFLEGEPCAGIYIVQDGWLKSVKSSLAGREQTIRLVGPGESFNEVPVFAGSTNQVTVIALEAASVWVVPSAILFDLIEQHPALCQMVIQNLARRTLHLMKLVEDLSLRPVEARLARFLLESAHDNVVSRKRWSTQVELASLLGTVPDVLNRALRSLVEEDLIQLERQHIVILKREQLEEKAMLES